MNLIFRLIKMNIRIKIIYIYIYIYIYICPHFVYQLVYMISLVTCSLCLIMSLFLYLNQDGHSLKKVRLSLFKNQDGHYFCGTP